MHVSSSWRTTIRAIAANRLQLSADRCFRLFPAAGHGRRIRVTNTATAVPFRRLRRYFACPALPPASRDKACASARGAARCGQCPESNSPGNAPAVSRAALRIQPG